jgi:hypothetical protein
LGAFCGGFRNQYDIDFSADGELFTYDSDMEWDVGLPWYRPTKIFHVTSGGEYGFREGSAKWPEYYPDSVATTADVGLGSPTGVKFGTNSNFPEKYRRAFYAMDWTYGRILAVHLKPDGSTFTAANPLENPYRLSEAEREPRGGSIPPGQGAPGYGSGVWKRWRDVFPRRRAGHAGRTLPREPNRNRTGWWEVDTDRARKC